MRGKKLLRFVSFCFLISKFHDLIKNFRKNEHHYEINMKCKIALMKFY